MYTSEECQQYTDFIRSAGTDFLQAWRLSPNDATHCLRIGAQDTKRTRKPWAVLDIGCGTGAFLWWQKQLCPSIKCYGLNLFENQVVVPPSVATVAQCDLNEQPDLEAVCKGKFLMEIPLFSTIVCHYTLGHLKSPLDVLRSARDVLANQSTMVIYDLHPRNMETKRTIFSYYCMRTSQEVWMLAKEAGFRDFHAQFPDAQFDQRIASVLPSEDVAEFVESTVPVIYTLFR